MDRAGAGIGHGSAMHETGQGRVRGTVGAGTGARTRQWQGRRAEEGQSRAMLGKGRARAVALQGAFGAPLLLLLFCFLSLLKKAPLVFAKNGRALPV